MYVRKSTGEIIGLREIKQDHPGISFAGTPSQSFLDDNGYAVLAGTQEPEYGEREYGVPTNTAVEENGEWLRYVEIKTRPLPVDNRTIEQKLSDYRDQKWSSNGVILSNNTPLESDQQTLNRVNDTIGGLIDNESGSPSAVRWKCADNEWRDLSLSDLQEYRVIHRNMRQAAFNAEETILNNNASTPYTDDSWQDDFDTAFEGGINGS